MELVVDRFEGEYAVCQECESKKVVNLPLNMFTAEIRSGDLVSLVDGKITVLPNDKLKEQIKEKISRLWK